MSLLFEARIKILGNKYTVVHQATLNENDGMKTRFSDGWCRSLVEAISEAAQQYLLNFLEEKLSGTATPAANYSYTTHFTL